MSTTRDTRPSDIEIVGGPYTPSDDELWGDVPRGQRLEWLRVASRNWPYFPGALVGGMTAQELATGRLVRSSTLIGVARNAYEAGFTPDEYAELRRLIRTGIPEHLIEARDGRPEYAARFFEIDAHRWRGWLARVRAGQPGDVAMSEVIAAEA